MYGHAAAAAGVGRHPGYLGCYRRGRIDDRSLAAGDIGDRLLKERIVGAPQNQGVGTLIEDRSQVAFNLRLSHRTIDRSRFNQLRPTRTGLGDYLQPGGIAVAQRSKQLALKGGRGGEYPDDPVTGDGGGRFQGWLHPHEWHFRKLRSELVQSRGRSGVAGDDNCRSPGLQEVTGAGGGNGANLVKRSFAIGGIATIGQIQDVGAGEEASDFSIYGETAHAGIKYADHRLETAYTAASIVAGTFVLVTTG